jgi:hypothetical protein
MRVLLPVLVLLCCGLSGCAVAEVGGAVVGAGVSVVSTTVDVAGDVVGGVASTVSGGSKDKESKQDKSGN